MVGDTRRQRLLALLNFAAWSPIKSCSWDSLKVGILKGKLNVRWRDTGDHCMGCTYLFSELVLKRLSKNLLANRLGQQGRHGGQCVAKKIVKVCVMFCKFRLKGDASVGYLSVFPVKQCLGGRWVDWRSACGRLFHEAPIGLVRF